MSTVQIKVKNYTEHGLMIREECPPEGCEIVDVYHPHTSPWDVYGLRHQKEFGFVLERAGIPYVKLYTRRTIIGPRGSGPEGRIRLGDDWTPGEYRLAVPAEQAAVARIALANHEVDLQTWLKDTTQPLPEACKQAY